METGSKLNQIQRPVFPWKMLFLALVLTAVSMLMSVIVLGELGRETQLIRGLFVAHGIEFLIINVFVPFTRAWTFLYGSERRKWINLYIDVVFCDWKRDFYLGLPAATVFMSGCFFLSCGIRWY